MPNRSHRNAGHRGMNLLRRRGLMHSSMARIDTAPIDETQHVVAVFDCLELLHQIADNSIQLVICDPPYNINVAQWDALKDYVDWGGRWLREGQGILSPTGNFVLFGGFQYQGEAGSGDLISLISWLRQNSSMLLANMIV